MSRTKKLAPTVPPNALTTLTKSSSPDSVREVEVGRGEGLDVVNVDMVYGEALAGAEVEAAADPVHLEVAVDLAALLQRRLLVDEPLPVLALLDAPRVELPRLLGVGVLHVLARVAALALLGLGAVAAAAGHQLRSLGPRLSDGKI